MTFLKKLMSGQLALWCTFWLIGAPLTFLWCVSGTCSVIGCGIRESEIEGILLALFALLSVILPFLSIAIWRSASKYPRQTWPQTLLAAGAKLCVTVFGLLALVGLAVLLYIAYYMFIYPALNTG
ncbi:MAG: hypothetical protein WAR76_18985 [Xanthobacteraceae bacterium]|jgi:hypothetical protein